MQASGPFLRHKLSSFLFLPPTQTINKHITLDSRTSRARCSNSPPNPLSLVHPTTVKIPSSLPTHFPIPNPTPPPSVPRGLNSSPFLVFDPVVNTDSQQSTWPPSSTPSQPAPSQPPSNQSFGQDFVLFDQPSNQLQPPLPNRAASQPSKGHHKHNTNAKKHRLSTSALQGLSPAQQHQLLHQRHQQLHNAASSARAFYSNSAPSSAAAVNQSQHRSHSQSTHRPPVPLFNQQSANMELDIDVPDVTFGGALSEFSSPADMVFDSFVTPNDLFVDLTAPNSAALTSLTTPGSQYEPSPAYTDWDNSPLFAAGDDAGNWPSLFPDAAPSAPVDQSPVVQPEEVEANPASRKSSAATSPSVRQSSVSGVSASRRRSKPLPPIHVNDAGDEKSMKRARNTLAARKSRARRQNHIEELEQQVRELEARAEKAEQERDHYKQLWETRT